MELAAKLDLLCEHRSMSQAGIPLLTPQQLHSG